MTRDFRPNHQRDPETDSEFPVEPVEHADSRYWTAGRKHGDQLSDLQLALLDIDQSVRRYWIWVRLAWTDIVVRYRGSLLGPFWLTLTTCVFVAGLGPLYATLFGLNASEYLPSMAIGIVTWSYISSCISEASRAFIDCAPTMKQAKLPWTIFIFHVVYRNLIIFVHNLPIIVAVLIYGGIPLSTAMLLVLPGFAIVTMNLIWVGLILAIIAARFRDVIPVVTSVLTLAFFLSPVIWNPSMHRIPDWVLYMNPFAAMIQTIRDPLLGTAPSLVFFLITGVGAIFGSMISVVALARYRKYIIFWV